MPAIRGSELIKGFGPFTNPLIEANEMNPRYQAFLTTSAGKEYKSNTSRNAAFMAFISDMKCKFTGASNATDPQYRIEDHNAFTLFIQQQVAI